MTKNQSLEERAAALFKDFENGKAYQGTLGLRAELPVCVRFYEGKQWPAATKKTKNLPRPVFNIVKMICRSKKAAILSTPVRIVYKSDETGADVEKFNAFADYIQKEYGQDALDKKGIHDSVIKGTYVYHYFWDADAKGKKGRLDGALRCELIDPLNIFFADPTQTDEQKQKWILIASREPVDSVRAKADAGVDPDAITADEPETLYEGKEQEGEQICTVLTRYFRKDGEVWFEKGVKGTMVNAACPLCPDVERELSAIREDAPNNTLPDSRNEGEELQPAGVRAHRYPIVVGQYEPREHSIYGIGEVDGLLPNQKAINFNFAMILLNNREMAWGKYIVHPKALKGQTITDEPGQTLVDYSESGNGIQKMTEKGIQGQPLQLVDTMVQLTRSLAGANEVMSGEVIGANMSGSAIAQLQAQAKLPIEELRDAFWQVKEKQGRVLEQFFRLYYFDEPFARRIDEAELEKVGLSVPLEKELSVEDRFSSVDYADTDFSVVVEATAGTRASSAGDISALDALFTKGAISTRAYIQSYPDDALSNKSELLKSLEEEEKSEINTLRAQVTQAQAEMQQYAALLEEQRKTVDQVLAVMNENKRLKEALAALYTEAGQKIALANEQIELGNQRIRQTTADASAFAEHIAKTNGLGGVL